MKTFKKQFPDIYRYHQKELKKFSKTWATPSLDCFGYLGTYLRYLRDYYALMTPVKVDLTEDVKFITLASALAEFDAYNTCIMNYYVINDRTGLLELKDKNQTREDTLKEFQKERQVHWSTFWELVRQCLEGWTKLNDSTI